MKSRPAAGSATGYRPECVDSAVVWGGRPIRRDLLLHRRKHPQVSNERTNVLFVPVGGVVPGHPLPMQYMATATDPAADRA